MSELVIPYGTYNGLFISGYRNAALHRGQWYISDGELEKVLSSPDSEFQMIPLAERCDARGLIEYTLQSVPQKEEVSLEDLKRQRENDSTLKFWGPRSVELGYTDTDEYWHMMFGTPLPSDHPFEKEKRRHLHSHKPKTDEEIISIEISEYSSYTLQAILDAGKEVDSHNGEIEFISNYSDLLLQENREETNKMQFYILLYSGDFLIFSNFGEREEKKYVRFIAIEMKEARKALLARRNVPSYRKKSVSEFLLEKFDVYHSIYPSPFDDRYQILYQFEIRNSIILNPKRITKKVMDSDCFGEYGWKNEGEEGRELLLDEYYKFHTIKRENKEWYSEWMIASFAKQNERGELNYYILNWEEFADEDPLEGIQRFQSIGKNEMYVDEESGKEFTIVELQPLISWKK